MDKILDRWQGGTLRTLLRERRALLLAGPRQCGKTTLVRQLAGPQMEYRTLDDAVHRTLADSDPEGFVRHGKAGLIIDEIQKAPALLPAIKQVVDQSNQPGQFLLTGSANVQALPAVQESLAGRIAKIRLRPFAAGELRQGQPDFLPRCFAQDFATGDLGAGKAAPGNQVSSRDRLLDAALRGGFPEAVRLEPRARQRWHLDYLGALLERDLVDISRIRRQEALQELARILAAWSSKQMDTAKIGARLAIRRPTLESYVNMMEALFIIERVPPWTQGDYSRAGRRKKLFMADSGMMASILGFKAEQVRLDPDRAGKLMETFIHNELAAQVDAADGAYGLHHYRDRDQRELDFVIERDDGALLGLEAKAAATVKQEDFRHLAWFRDRVAGARPFVGALLYAGEHTGRFGDRLWAVSAPKALLGDYRPAGAGGLD